MLSRVPFPYTASDATAWLQRVAAKDQPKRGLHLAILIHETLVGVMSLEDQGKESRQLGYWLRSDCWGEGYATEAGRAVLAHAFDQLGLDRVSSCVFVDNPASLRVQKKLGFVEVGTHRGYSLARQGEVENIDTALSRERFREFAE